MLGTKIYQQRVLRRSHVNYRSVVSTKNDRNRFWEECKVGDMGYSRPGDVPIDFTIVL